MINGINSPDISAKSLVSFYTMGHSTGEYLAQKHPAGSPPVKVGWFPGPAGAGWVEAANKGFLDAVKGTAVEVLPPKYGDTGKEVQLKLVEDVLQANPDMNYIAGTAVTAEAAMGLLRERGLIDKIGLLAFYMTPGVYEGIERGFITAAPADSMVIQGRIAIDQAVRLLEGKDVVKHVGPKIFVVDVEPEDRAARQHPAAERLQGCVQGQLTTSPRGRRPGRRLPCAAWPDPQKPLVEARGLTKRYPGVIALDNVDFDLERRSPCPVWRERRGQIDPDFDPGRGLRPDRGTIEIAGESVSVFSRCVTRAGSGIGRCSRNSRWFPR